MIYVYTTTSTFQLWNFVCECIWKFNPCSLVATYSWSLGFESFTRNHFCTAVFTHSFTLFVSDYKPFLQSLFICRAKPTAYLVASILLLLLLQRSSTLFWALMALCPIISFFYPLLCYVRVPLTLPGPRGGEFSPPPWKTCFLIADFQDILKQTSEIGLINEFSQTLATDLHP